MNDDNSVLENLRSSYYNAVIAAPSIKEMSNVLPDEYDPNYEFFLSNIAKLLLEEIDELKIYMNEDDDETLKNYYRDEILSLVEKTKYCTSLLKKKKNEEINSSDLVNSSNDRRLVFAKSKFGNNLFLNDLKSIPTDYYDSILSLLEDIKNDTIDMSNQSKYRRFGSNNNKLRGHGEFKAFKIRIIVSPLTNGDLYISMVREKKDNNSLKDIEVPARRIALVSSNYREIKKMLDDPIKSELVYKEGIDDYNKVISYLSGNKNKGDETNGK